MSKILYLSLLSMIVLQSCANRKSTAPEENQSANAKATENDQGDYRLHDIWALESIDGEPVNPETEVPNLEFHLADKRLLGYGGCNRISGSFELAGDALTFGPVMSTKKACPDLQLETRFLKAIDGKELKYRIEENRLTLSGQGATLVFKKVD